MSEIPHSSSDPGRTVPESVLEEFEDAWQSGAAPSIAEFLGRAASRGSTERPIDARALLEELVRIDLEYRWRRSGSLSGSEAGSLPRLPVLENYLERFPALGPVAEIPRDLVAEEYRVRRQWGDKPDAWEYVDRFPHLAEVLPTVLLEIDRESALERRRAVKERADNGMAGFRNAMGDDVSLGQFVRCLVRSGLMTADEVDAVQRRLPDDRRPTSAAELAGLLCEQQVLTDYQTGVLSRGSSDYLVLGDYVLLEILGSGGMGTVFRAQHRRMRRSVALKVLPENQLNSPEAVERFHREVEAAGRVSHPNIVTAFDAREDDGLHYLVMEYVEGEDLARMVKYHGPLQARLALDCVLQAARGLACAHAAGIVHRDVKPSNLLRNAEGIVKVLDLGLARLERRETSPLEPSVRSELTEMGITMGTVGFMAPEQAVDSRQADPRADIYSLGCTLYYLLTARPMFPGRSKMQELIAHREESPPALRDMLPGLPESLDRVWQQMVSRHPGDRPESMDDVIAQLQQIIDNGELPAEEPETVHVRRAADSSAGEASTDRHGAAGLKTDAARTDAHVAPTQPAGTALSNSDSSGRLVSRTVLATLGSVVVGGLLVMGAMSWFAGTSQPGRQDSGTGTGSDTGTVRPDVPGGTGTAYVAPIGPEPTGPAGGDPRTEGSGAEPAELPPEAVGLALESLEDGGPGELAIRHLTNQLVAKLADDGRTALVVGRVDGPAGTVLGQRVRAIMEDFIGGIPFLESEMRAARLNGDVWLMLDGDELSMSMELELRDVRNRHSGTASQTVLLREYPRNPGRALQARGPLAKLPAVATVLDALADEFGEYLEELGETQYVLGTIEGPRNVDVTSLREALQQRLGQRGLKDGRRDGLKLNVDLFIAEDQGLDGGGTLRLGFESVVRDRQNQKVRAFRHQAGIAP